MTSWIQLNTTDFFFFKLTVHARNLIMGHGWIFQQDNDPQTNIKTKTKMGHWAQNQASAMAIPVLWPEPCRKWVRWTEEKKLWIWRIWRDSGWRNGLWSLIRCSLTSSGIIGENSELLSWQKEVAKSIESKGMINCLPMCIRENPYFIKRFLSHFKLLFSNERLDFCTFLK